MILYRKAPTTDRTILDAGDADLKDPKIKAPKKIITLKIEKGWNSFL